MTLLLLFSFSFFRILYFSGFVVVFVRELCALIQLCVATNVRSNCLSPPQARAPPLGGVVPCVRQRIYSCFLLLQYFASALRNIQGRRAGPCGGGAESHTYSPHDARSVRIRAFRFGQRTSIALALFIHSAACQLPKKWLRNMTTRKCEGRNVFCCLEITLLPLMYRPTDHYLIVNFEIGTI